MINKFPQKALKKWHRFQRLEKFFLVYIIVLLLSILYFPILKIVPIEGETTYFRLINTYFFNLNIIIIILSIVLLLWNISYRFKRLTYLMLGFKSNDGFINFLIILFFSVILLTIGETTTMVSQKFTSTLQISTGYYIIGFLLILGLIINLFLSLEMLKSKKKDQFVKIVNNSSKEEENKQNIKGLFENTEQKETDDNESN